MGGCRCTFRNCSNSSTNRPGLHFFHFPYRTPERCEKWAHYSNNVSFLQLPINKLRNKVVCEEHFRESGFMNSRKERLIKSAIPTLLKLDSGEIIDYEVDENNKTMYDVHAEKNSTYEMGNSAPKLLNKVVVKPETITMLQTLVDNEKYDLCIERMDNLSEQEHFLLPETITKPIEPVLIHHDVPPKLLNSLPSTSLKKIDILAPIKLAKRKMPVVSAAQVKKEKIQKIKTEFAVIDEKGEMTTHTLDALEIEGITELSFENTEPITIQIQKSDNKLTNKQSEQLKKRKDLVSEENAELKKVQANIAVNPVLTPLPPVKPHKLEKGPPLTKAQLFNGIRKYLNPSMVALLRMELFGDPEREYKSDEQNFSMELLELKGNVYDYMRSEWRFRLPPKSMVQTWIEQREASECNEEEWDEN